MASKNTGGLRRWWWLLPLALVVLLGVGAVAFAVWATAGPDPMPEALAALESDDEVQVDTDPWLTFHPMGEDPTVGLILYPGARIDPRAYAPTARAIAAEGYVVTITPMPLNLAFFAPAKAAEVIAANPGVERWAVGGHSLGGSMAARFAFQHPASADGMVLWASYPAASDDFSGRGLEATSIYGTLDGLATVDEVNASRPLLPAGTAWVGIEGGNHAQFGWYGPQSGDNPAAISREEQQAQIVAGTLDLLGSLRDQGQ